MIKAIFVDSLKALKIYKSKNAEVLAQAVLGVCKPQIISIVFCFAFSSVVAKTEHEITEGYVGCLF